MPRRTSAVVKATMHFCTTMKRILPTINSLVTLKEMKTWKSRHSVTRTCKLNCQIPFSFLGEERRTRVVFGERYRKLLKGVGGIKEGGKVRQVHKPIPNLPPPPCLPSPFPFPTLSAFFFQCSPLFLLSLPFKRKLVAKTLRQYNEEKKRGGGSIAPSTLKFPWVTNTEFLLTMSIQYHEFKWWEERKISIEKLLVDPIPNTPNYNIIMRIVWLTVRWITK